MKPLTRFMEDALLGYRASDEEFEEVVGVREQTRLALEERGLTESKLHPDPRRARWWDFVYRRTVAGDNLAIEISLAREVDREEVKR